MVQDLQARFAHALLDRGAAIPEGVGATSRRFAVHRNNVTAALVGALETRFPISLRIVGERFFRAMCADYVRAFPPRSPVLMAYGGELPAFVERFEPASAVPYLPDVMRLEIARSEACHAPDADAATAGELAALGPAGLARARVRAHPAARLVSSSHPVATIAAMHAPGAEPFPIEGSSGEDVVVARPRLAVTTTKLPPGGLAFLLALWRGGTVEEAIAGGLLSSPEFDPASALAGLITTGAIQGFHDGDFR
jgi:hypothetical protein